MEEDKFDIISEENIKSAKYRISTIVFILALISSIIMFIFHKFYYGISLLIYAFLAIFIPKMKINGKVNDLATTIFILTFLLIGLLIMCYFKYIFFFPWSWFY